MVNSKTKKNKTERGWDRLPFHPLPVESTNKSVLSSAPYIPLSLKQKFMDAIMSYLPKYVIPLDKRVFQQRLWPV